MAPNGTSALFVSEDAAILNTVSTIAANIAYQYFELRFVTMVMFNAMDIVGVTAFLKLFNKSIVVKVGEFAPLHSVHVRQFVLFADDAADAASYLQWLVASRFDNAGSYIIVCASEDPAHCDEQIITRTCLKLRIMNMVLLKAATNSGEFAAYTFFPVTDDMCYNSEPVRLDVSLNCSIDCYRQVFPEKLANVHRCDVTVSTFEQHPFMYLNDLKEPPGGGDGEILNTVLEKLNATLKIVTPSIKNWGHFQNNNWSGSLGDVFNDRAQFSVCAAPLTDRKYGNFQVSFPYNSIEMVWVAGMPPLKPSYEKILYPLKYKIRILIVFMFSVIILMHYFMKTKYWSSFRRVMHVDVTKNNIVLYAWMMLLGLPVSRFPRNSTLLATVYIWIWFCFIIRTVYQAALIGTLKNKHYDEKLDSFKDVLRSKRPFGGLDSLKEYYSDDPHIYDNWINLELDEMYRELHKMSNGQSDFVMGINKLTALEYMIYYRGTQPLQFVPEIIVNSPSVMFFKRFSPLAESVNRVLVGLVESGGADHMYKYFYEQEKILVQRSNGNAEPLGLRHMSSSLIVMLVGTSLSIFFFCIELIFGKMALK